MGSVGFNILLIKKQREIVKIIVICNINQKKKQSVKSLKLEFLGFDVELVYRYPTGTIGIIYKDQDKDFKYLYTEFLLNWLRVFAIVILVR